MLAMSVISWPIGAIAKLSTIINICKYEGFQEGHHFIPMAMEMHDALGVIWIISLGNVLVFSMIDDQEVISPCPFAFNFLNRMLILLFCVL